MAVLDGQLVAPENPGLPLFGKGTDGAWHPLVVDGSGQLQVVGNKTNNTDPPGSDNFGTLPAVATAAEPPYVEGNQVAGSTDLFGRWRTYVSSWFGSTAPTVGQKPMVDSIPVTFASDQSPLPISIIPTDAVRGIDRGRISLGGGSANTEVAINATVYNEQAVNAQRSFASSSASDTAAGTGAQQVTLSYLDATGTGPFFETVTLNGLTPVNTVATNICFINDISVIRVGSGGRNVGTITLFVGLAGAGGTITTIGVGNLTAALGDNITLHARHYVPLGKTASLVTLVCGLVSGTGGSNGSIYLKSLPLGVVGGVDQLIGDLIPVTTGQAIVRQLGIPIVVVGPARVVAYGVPTSNNTILAASFDFSEVSS